MSTLNRAIEIATKAHDGATDKYGVPYINHVTRVMNMGQTDNALISSFLFPISTLLISYNLGKFSELTVIEYS